MTGLKEKLTRNLTARKLLAPGATLVAAISGGADSMVLLHLLHDLSAKFHWRLVVAHFNHCLRGRAGDQDARFVEKTARQMGLVFATEAANVAAEAARASVSIEMAARRLRHEFLARVALHHKARVAVLAHHADDQVELFFLRLLRGAGSDGLAGMKWSSPSPANPKVKLARPLLNVRRAEILAYAEENRVPYRHDASNFSDEPLRNRIRLKLLPLLAKWQPGFDRTLPRVMEIIGEESAFLEASARAWLKRGKPPFRRLPLALQRRCLVLQLRDLGAEPKFEIIEHLRQKPGVPWSGDAKTVLVANRQGVVARRRVADLAFQPDELPVDLTEPEGKIDFGDCHLSWRVEPRPRRLAGGSSAAGGVEYFDARKIGARLTLRHWRAGDRFHPIGAPAPLKLQDFFTNQKVPRAQRRRLVVAEAGDGRLFWVEGRRISECFKLDKTSQFALRWQWRRRRMPDCD